MIEKKLLRIYPCPSCQAEKRYRCKLLEALIWFLIVAVSFWILLEIIGMAAIALIAARGPMWTQ